MAKPTKKSESGAGDGKFIQKAIKKPGALHQQLGVPMDKNIPAKKLNKAAAAPGKLGQRARLAQTLKGLGKGKKKGAGDMMGAAMPGAAMPASPLGAVAADLARTQTMRQGGMRGK